MDIRVAMAEGRFIQYDHGPGIRKREERATKSDVHDTCPSPYDSATLFYRGAGYEYVRPNVGVSADTNKTRAILATYCLSRKNGR